jgi:hypothetical protein
MCNLMEKNLTLIVDSKGEGFEEKSPDSSRYFEEDIRRQDSKDSGKRFEGERIFESVF